MIAPCTNQPALFDPQEGDETDNQFADRIELAQRYCDNCTIRDSCLAGARDNGSSGVYAGIPHIDGKPVAVIRTPDEPPPGGCAECGKELRSARARFCSRRCSGRWVAQHPKPRTHHAPCGTPAAARRHRRRHEPVCDLCRRADRRHRASQTVLEISA